MGDQEKLLVFFKENQSFFKNYWCKVFMEMIDSAIEKTRDKDIRKLGKALRLVLSAVKEAPYDLTDGVLKDVISGARAWSQAKRCGVCTLCIP